jgi:hypothetical protein
LAQRAKASIQQAWSEIKENMPNDRDQPGVRIAKKVAIAAVVAGVLVVAFSSAPVLGAVMIAAGIGGYAIVCLQGHLFNQLHW